MTRTKQIAFAAIPSIAGVALLTCAWFKLEPAKTSQEKGDELIQRAWSASFTERNWAVPESGPRDGWMSIRLLPKTVDSDLQLGWTEREQSLKGLIRVDSNGLQIWRSQESARARVLIVGASVAWGACASS